MSTSESGAALVVRESKLGLRLTSVVLLASSVAFFALLPSDRVFGDGGGRLGRLSEGVQEVLLVACGVGAALVSVAFAAHRPRLLLTLSNGVLTTFTRTGDAVAIRVAAIERVAVVSPDEVPPDQRSHTILATSVLRIDGEGSRPLYVSRTRPMSPERFLVAIGQELPEGSPPW